MEEKGKSKRLGEYVGKRVKPIKETILCTITKGSLKKQLAEQKRKHPDATRVATFKLKKPASAEYCIEQLNVASQNYNQGDKLTKDGVFALFKEISADAAKNKYYVGVTCNPEEREDAHNAEFLAVVDCPSLDAAKELEKQMDKKGYDAGKVQANLHKKESKKVYIYKKTPITKP